MKLIYIPKYQNEKRPFKVTQIIQRVISNEDVDGLVFLSGYMSSSQGTIQNFISQMQNLGVKNKTVLLFNGMNGNFLEKVLPQQFQCFLQFQRFLSKKILQTMRVRNEEIYVK